MRCGWLIYEEEGARRNEWFIAECLRCAKELGLDLRLKIVRDGRLSLSEETPDFALVRTIAPKFSRVLEEAGVTVVNGAETSRIANDKWETYRFAREVGLRGMPTRLSAECADCSPFGYPVVIKSRDGHGGREVFKLDSQKDYEAFWRMHSPERFITQAMCSEVGKDLRVYVLGGTVLAAVLRTSATDFRSNFSLGGEVRCVAVPAEVEQKLQILQEKLRLDFVGVDFIRHEGEWILNEIEDVVGCRMLYKTTQINVAWEYLAYVKNTVEKTF